MKKARIRFSLGWCIGVFLVHLGVTLLLGLAMFVSGMGSFTHDPGPVYYGGKAVMWVWSPLVMMMVEGHNLEIAHSPEIGPVLWSMMVGLLAGLIGGTLSKPGRKRQVDPGTNPDLIGTPWVHDSGFTLGKTDSAALNEQAEQAGRGVGDKPPK